MYKCSQHQRLKFSNIFVKTVITNLIVSQKLGGAGADPKVRLQLDYRTSALNGSPPCQPPTLVALLQGVHIRRITVLIFAGCLLKSYAE